ncbi:MAG: hypothetical protein NTX79_04845 [Candidatus Micrarchaeota archaeon]|nr:hypothetical protein [Candidatus Micrarchaeota archaeon]
MDEKSKNRTRDLPRDLVNRLGEVESEFGSSSISDKRWVLALIVGYAEYRTREIDGLYSFQASGAVSRAMCDIRKQQGHGEPKIEW